MRNRSLLWIFVILLTLSVVYVLSFGFVAKRYENKIAQIAKDSLEFAGVSGPEYDSTLAALQAKLLRDSADAKAYPVFGHSYNYLKQRELNLGLDLRGGMSVTLEVSIPDLLISLSDNSENKVFRKSIEDAKLAQRSSNASFIDLFASAWKANNKDGIGLWRIFDTMENKGKFPSREVSDDEIIAILRKEAEDAINNTENIIKKRVDQFGVIQPNIQKQSLSGRIIVELPGVDDRERVRQQLKATANLEFWDTYRMDQALYNKLNELNFILGKKYAPDLYSQDPDQPRKDSLFMAALQDPDLTSVQIDSLRNLYSDKTVKPDSALTRAELLRKYPLAKLAISNQAGSPIIGFAQVSDTADLNRWLYSPEVKAELPADLRLMWAAKPQGNVVTLYGIRDKSLKGKAELDGRSITDARKDYDPITGEVMVSMTMNTEGAAIWREMTRVNAADNQRPIAIVMDNLVYSAPSVNTEIPTGNSSITFGSGAGRDQIKIEEEAADLAGLLKAGSLPAPAKIIDEVTVGPSLGEENIKAGIWSFIIAFILILIYMVFYYAWAGWAANVALIANLFFLIGALVSFGGVLTLPGIAGIVLTMGMAVDANVLIYERVKEELRLGKSISAAMNDGFLKAISAIVDGNATTLITGIVLFVVGTGPIKGFATTLIIGIFTTLFTAIIISRLILYRRLENKKPITFYSNITKNWFTNFNYDFVGKRKMFYVVSIVFFLIGITSWVTRGFNMGVDFAGGTSAKVVFASAVDADQVRDVLGKTLIEEDGQTAAYMVQNIGAGSTDFKITTNYLMNSNSNANSEDATSEKLKEAFNKLGVDYKIDSTYQVDPTMSDDFRKEAIWAGALCLILIGIYMWLRFRKWDFAIGASVALFHDALFVIMMFTLFNGILPFSLEVNQNFVGAILTVIGYSINDTVVIFDRVREYTKIRRNAPLDKTINDALNSTMGRSINTSMTVLLTLIVMFIFGSDDIKGFCFAMIVGVLSGVYSTLFIATPIVADLRKLFGMRTDVV
ncbi:MAG TPA: protein translocase subunit SecDF [Flavobacteriales bacterium]